MKFESAGSQSQTLSGQTVTEVFESILRLKYSGRGRLKLASIDAQATVLVFNGFIVSANLSSKVEMQGTEAIYHIMRMGDVTHSFDEDEALGSEEVVCHVSLRKLIDSLSPKSLEDSLPAHQRKPGEGDVPTEESSLTEPQRLLLESVRMLGCSESFYETSGELSQFDDEVSKEQYKKLLSSLEALSDPKAFNEVSLALQSPDEEVLLAEEIRKAVSEVEIDNRSFEDRIDALSDQSSLDEKQKTLLDVVSTLPDVESFHDTEGIIADAREVVIRDEDRWALEEMAHAKTPEQQLAEFTEQDKSLAAELKKTSLSDFAEYADLDAIATPVAPSPLEMASSSVLPSDANPLLPAKPDILVDPKSKRNGLIGRMKDAIDRRKMGAYDGPMPTAGPNLTPFIGPAILTVICVALFTVPAMLTNAASRTDRPELAREQMRLMIEEDINHSIPYAQHDPEATHKEVPNTQTYSRLQNAATFDGLGWARSLVSKGRVDDAVKEYETYLVENPDSANARLELIHVYLRQGKKEKARWHCLRGMKSKCTPEELDQFWALFRQVML